MTRLGQGEYAELVDWIDGFLDEYQSTQTALRVEKLPAGFGADGKWASLKLNSDAAVMKQECDIVVGIGAVIRGHEVFPVVWLVLSSVILWPCVRMLGLLNVISSFLDLGTIELAHNLTSLAFSPRRDNLRHGDCPSSLFGSC
ncbi:hypothetical protein Q3G72_029868 [Acer saccharum]|nr:hypothetical protein Q3G72_029868 [Acer saccharum]